MKKSITIIFAILSVLMLFSCSGETQLTDTENETENTPESGSIEALFWTDCTADEGYELAKNNDVVLFADGLVSGKEVWDSFYSKTLKGESAKVLVAEYYVIGDNVSEEYYEAEKDNYPCLYFTLLEYDGTKFSLKTRGSLDGECVDEGEYKYLNHSVEEAPDTANYSVCDGYILADSPDVTHETWFRAMASSQSTDHIKAYPVYTDYIGQKEQQETGSSD